MKNQNKMDFDPDNIREEDIRIFLEQKKKAKKLRKEKKEKHEIAE